jgi:hypothetical protein
VNPFDFAVGLAAGLGVAAGLYAVLWWLGRRQRARAESSMGAPIERPELAAEPGSPMAVEALPAAPRSEAAVPKIEKEVADPSGTIEVTPNPSARPRATPSGTLRLSQRVILHVYAQGAWPPGEVAPGGLCQAGMVEALGIPQTGLAAVLRRLEAAGVLLGERAHVRGHDRRLKVYRLSSRGMDLAQELRRRTRGKGER